MFSQARFSPLKYSDTKILVEPVALNLAVHWNYLEGFKKMMPK